MRVCSGAWLAFYIERGLQCLLCRVASRTGSEDRAICWAGRLSHFLLSRGSYPPLCPQPEASSHPNEPRAPTEGSFPFRNATWFLVLGVSLDQTKLYGGLSSPQCTAQMGERVPECLGWVCIRGDTVEEIKELLSRWKGLLHCFQTATGEGAERTKTQAETH